MKLSKSSKIHVLIRKQGSPTAHITLEDTTITEAADYIKGVLRGHVDPFAQGRATSITLTSNARGEDKEKSFTFSFKGMEPREVKLILCEAIMSDIET